MLGRTISILSRPALSVAFVLAILAVSTSLSLAAPAGLHAPSVGQAAPEAPTPRTPALIPAAEPFVRSAAGPLDRPLAGPVNPQGTYSAEPAPMGVADFGIDGSGAPYSYSTSTFLGIANLTALKANDVANPSVGNVAFELNTVLTFQVGSKAYVYWLQDGFDVESHSEHVALLQDYVWNFSTPSASLNASSVAGNGSFVNYGGYNVYISYPPKTLPGATANLTFPMLLGLRIVSGTAGSQGVPWVGYDYNDGFGWIRGSNVSFPFAGGASSVGQFVNGNAYTPHGAYYDAEFVYAGPGGGVGLDVGSSMRITLDRSTGHNLAPVPNAYDHGGNTGERIENLSVVPIGGTGSPGAALSPGTGTLGLLYSANQTGRLRVTAPWSAGTIGVNGVPVAFTGGEADLTLLPGSYGLTLYEGTAIVGRASALVNAGSNGTVDLVTNLLERVTIHAAGLPDGTAWSIWWNGTRYNATSPSITLVSLNGSYSLSTSAVPGFLPKVLAEVVSVRGPTSATLDWTTFNYTVTFAASGLPAGTAWWVTAGGVRNTSTGASLTLELPNGTDPYQVGCAFAYFPVTAEGNVTVEAA
ncbi:MAG TPA: thermopsin family protease, partial [Thermoplasmata archaeon]|nr:thermopsin family protease [Thermoplasmata archaeon]